MGSSRRWGVLAAVLLARAAVGQGFEAVLWRHRGPALSAAFAASLKQAGLTAVCVDQDEDPKQCAALGIRFYLDHAAGKGTLHLRDPEFKRRLRAYEKSRSVADLVRPRPLLDRRVRADLVDLVAKRVTRAKPFRPLMISLDDEISTTRLANPLDFCFHPTTLAAFRGWLRARYGDVDRLNRAWGSEWGRFEDVVPPTTDEVRARELRRTWPRRLTDWSDHKEFMDIVLAETVGYLAARSREHAPLVKVGFEGGQAPSAFGGFDWSRLLPNVDYVEPYDIGGTRELVRSLARPGTLHYETVFPETDPLLSLRAVARIYDAAAHGLSGVIVWSAGEFYGGTDPRKLSSYGALLARELPRVTGKAGRILAGAEVFAGEIAILESQANVRLHWMLDSSVDGKTWPRRFGSYEAKHSTSQAARLSWIRLLQDLGYAFRFVTPAQLALPRFGGGRAPRALILPAALALSGTAIGHIVGFAEAGGLVIADETPGRYTDRLVLREKPGLDRLFGIERSAGRRFYRNGAVVAGAPRLASGFPLVETGLEPEGVTIAHRLGASSRTGSVLRAVAARRDAPALASWCQFERSAGKGRAVLLNLAVADYARRRLVASEGRACRDLRNRCRRLLQKHGLFETSLASVANYPTILERIVLTKGDTRVLVVRANCLENPKLFRELVGRGPQRMTIVLPMAAQLRDLWTGKVVGRGRRIRTLLDPLRGSFFTLEPF